MQWQLLFLNKIDKKKGVKNTTCEADVVSPFRFPLLFRADTMVFTTHEARKRDR